ncbi:MAG: tRNA(Ile)-lysidine synthase [Chlamydiia bacterium]|nr:tRNA(Ile)-lysidine synthase [Chlamydiia bacterium]
MTRCANKLMNAVFEFVQTYINPMRPVLLGLSGGPDSMALLYILLECRKQFSFLLHLVHIDHGWREESCQECEQLKELAASLQLPFHTTRLNHELYTGNIEAAARDDRLRYFTQVAQEIDAQGVFLAHHLQDQAETVFKRFLEGATLSHLSGMRKIVSIKGLTLFRPFLECSKKDILAWIAEKKIPCFEDVTNQDVRFLRARMREEIFPFLQQSFGKEFQENITRIASDADEMRRYFDEKAMIYLERPLVGDYGILFDWSSLEMGSPIEGKELFRRLSEMYGFSLSRYQLQLATELLLSNSANKSISLIDRKIYFDRKRVFITPLEDTVLPQTPQLLVIGQQHFGSWKVTVTEGSGEQNNHWKDVWKGKCSTVLPQGEYYLSPAKNKTRRLPQNKFFDYVLNEKKVPRIAAHRCPVVINGQGIAEDFLLGYKSPASLGTIHIALEKI